MSDDGLGFETLAFDDIRRWQAAMKLVDGAISSLRAAGTDEEVVAATRDLLMATSPRSRLRIGGYPPDESVRVTPMVWMCRRSGASASTG